MTDKARTAPLELSPDEFRRLGHRLVNRLADFLASLPSRPVTRNDSPSSIRAFIGNGPLPESGAAPAALLDEVVDVLVAPMRYRGAARTRSRASRTRKGSA